MMTFFNLVLHMHNSDCPDLILSHIIHLSLSFHCVRDSSQYGLSLFLSLSGPSLSLCSMFPLSAPLSQWPVSHCSLHSSFSVWPRFGVQFQCLAILSLALSAANVSLCLVRFVPLFFGFNFSPGSLSLSLSSFP